MRKLLLISIAVLVLCPVLSAQRPASDRGGEFRHNEIGLSYGVGTTPTVINAFATIFSLGTTKLDNMSYGALSLDYHYFPIKHVGIGGTICYEQGFTDEHRDYTTNSHYFTLMAGAKFYWFNTPYVGMYSRASLGATAIYRVTDGDIRYGWLPAYQLGIAGIEVGGKVRGFFEFGSGNRGVFQAGIRAKF